MKTLTALLLICGLAFGQATVPTLGRNNTWTAPNTWNGTETHNGAATHSGVESFAKFNNVRYVGAAGIQAAINDCPSTQTGACLVVDARPAWLTGSGSAGTPITVTQSATIVMGQGISLSLGCGIRYSFTNASGPAIQISPNSDIWGCGGRPPTQGGTEIYVTNNSNTSDALSHTVASDFSLSSIRDLRITDARATPAGAGIRIIRATNGSYIDGVRVIGFVNGIQLDSGGVGTDGPNFMKVSRSFVTLSQQCGVKIDKPNETVLLEYMGIDNSGLADGQPTGDSSTSHYGGICVSNVDASRGNIIINTYKYEHTSNIDSTSTMLYLDNLNGAPVTATGLHIFKGASAGTSGTGIVIAGGTAKLQLFGYNFVNTTGGYGAITNVLDDRFKTLTPTVANWGYRFSEIIWDTSNSFYRINGKVLHLSGGFGYEVCDIAASCTSLTTTAKKLNLAQGSGLVPVASLGSGTPTGAKFLRDDQTFVAPPVGAPAVVRGYCTGVAAPSTTIAMYQLGQMTSSSCSNTNNNYGSFVSPSAGTLQNLSLFSATGGVNASSGACTVFINASPAFSGGASTALTCTFGTGTTCSDYTHTVAVARGDLVQVRCTTQALETLGNIQATLEKN